jgi:hypothetical protein
MATDSEKVCASDEKGLNFLSSETACVSRTACFLLRTATQTVNGSVDAEVKGNRGRSAFPSAQLVPMESVAFELAKQVALLL